VRDLAIRKFNINTLRNFPAVRKISEWPEVLNFFNSLLITLFCLALSLLIYSSSTFADTSQNGITFPIPFVASYKVTKGIMSVGTTRRTLQFNGDDNYVFESVTKPGGIAKLFTSGKVVERSNWRFAENKLVPQEYSYVNTSDQKRNVKVEFDWETYKVTNTVNGDPWTMEIVEDTLDKLIYQLAIMYDLSRGTKKLVYQVADGGRIKTYDIKIAGNERLVLELGIFNTVKVERTNNDRTTIMWCAEELQYFPVKIEQKTKDDGSVTAELVEISGINVPDSVKPAEQKPAP